MGLRIERFIIVSVALLILGFAISSFHFLNHLDGDTLSRRKPFPPGYKLISVKESNSKVQQTFLTNIDSDKDTFKTPFPQSIDNEAWETIIHPAVVMSSKIHQGDHSDSVAELSVPKFWNPLVFRPHIRQYLGNYGEKLMTKQEASRIGSYTPSLKGKDIFVGDGTEVIEKHDEDGKEIISVTYELDEVPPTDLEMLETIFVSISSYRDSRCGHTVKQIFRQATYPERIRVAVVDQIDEEEDEYCVAKDQSSCEENSSHVFCKYGHQIDYFVMDAKLAVGPVFARHIGQRMYRGEYFTMQTDAHMEFINGWDVDVINQWKSAKNEMAVLTTYVSSVVDHYDKENGTRKTNSRPFMCESDFEINESDASLSFLMHGQQPEEPPLIQSEPLMQPFWAAGFSFARGHFSVQVPYDQYLPMIFQGEEISIGIRAFTYGYDMYAPAQSVLFHYYNLDPDVMKKKKVPKFWEHAEMYEGVEDASKARLLGILGMRTISEIKVTNEEAEALDEVEAEKSRTWISIESQLYGTGKVRSVKQYLDTFGIHLENHTVEKNLCNFVSKQMTELFSKFIRSDGMGVDYDRLEFRYKDSNENRHDNELDIEE